MPRDHCGYKEYLFGESILFELDSDVKITNRIVKSSDGEMVTVLIDTRVENSSRKDLELYFVVDGKSEEVRKVDGTIATGNPSTIATLWSSTGNPIPTIAKFCLFNFVI